MRRSAEDVIAGFAERQHDVVTRRQLLGAGITSRAIQGLLERNRLRRIYRGVYGTTAALSERARLMGAVLAAGGRAAISHASAVWLSKLLPAMVFPDLIDLSVAGTGGRRSGIRWHRVVALPPREIERVERIPVTSVNRTLVDFAAVAGTRELERATATALHRNLTTRRRLLGMVERYPNRPGTGALRQLLAAGQAPAFTRSEAEERFLDLVRRAELEPPETNVRIAPYEVDFLWRPARLIVEIDGYAFHSPPRQFAADRRRDAKLTAAGYRVMRFTWEQIVDRREATLVALVQALGGTLRVG